MTDVQIGKFRIFYSIYSPTEYGESHLGHSKAPDGSLQHSANFFSFCMAPKSSQGFLFKHVPKYHLASKRICFIQSLPPYIARYHRPSSCGVEQENMTSVLALDFRLKYLSIF